MNFFKIDPLTCLLVQHLRESTEVPPTYSKDRILKTIKYVQNSKKKSKHDIAYLMGKLINTVSQYVGKTGCLKSGLHHV